MQEPEKKARRKLIEFPDELESPQKAEPAPISKGRKYIGLHMNRREAVNSVLTNFLTVPQKTASLLVEAWDARQSVCLIVSERAAQNLFVRSFLFHVSFLVTATADDHCGSWDNHRPNVQGLAALESGLSKNRLGPSDGPSFRVKWECFGLYCKSLFTDLADRDKEEMGSQATERMRREAAKERVPPPLEVAWVWCDKLQMKPPRGVQRPKAGQGHPHHKQAPVDERRAREHGTPPWGTASNGNDMQRRNWQSNGRPERDLRYEGHAGAPVHDGFIDRRAQGGRQYMGSDRGGSRERQDMGGWVSRGASGSDRAGGGAGGFLRKRMDESSVRVPGGGRSIPVGQGGAVSKHPNKNLTDLTFEEYLQVCGEIEEAYRHMLWHHRMSQPNARSEWRALCIQHKVPYQQSFQ